MMMLFLFMFPAAVFSQTKEIIATGEYVMGPGETMTVAEEKSLKAAERNAAEQAGAFIKSYTRVKNMEVTDDLIEVTANHAMKIEVLEKKKTVIGDVDAIKYHTKIRAVVTAEEIEKNLQKAREDSKTVEVYKALKSDYEKQTREMEELKKKLLAAKGEDRNQILEQIGTEEILFKANLMVEKGERLLYRGSDSDDAIEAFTEAIALNPNLAYAYWLRSWLYEITGHIDNALYDIEKAIDLQPNNTDFYAGRAALYLIKDCPETSTQGCEKALGRSLKDIELVIRQKPDDHRYYLLRAIMYAAAKKYDRAATDLTKVITMAQDNWPILAQAYVIKAEIAKERKDHSAALAEITTAITVLVNTKYYSEKLKKCSEIMNSMRKKDASFDEIKFAIAKAFQIDPENEKEIMILQGHLAIIFDLYKHRATIYSEMGNKYRAEIEMKTACEIVWIPRECNLSTETK
jgi:hypothetical protein